MTARVALAAALVAAAGCTLVPDVGPRLAGTCDDFAKNNNARL